MTYNRPPAGYPKDDSLAFLRATYARIFSSDPEPAARSAIGKVRDRPFLSG